MNRKPTDEEYADYDGMHCRGMWRKLPESWLCPGCNRSKRGIMVYGQRTGSNARTYGPVGFKCGIHEHHDHGAVDFATGKRGRFKPTIICGACNSADAIAKRQVGAPSNFSFSPAEIRQFVVARDNEGHRFDFARAKNIYDALSKEQRREAA